MAIPAAGVSRAPLYLSASNPVLLRGHRFHLVLLRPSTAGSPRPHPAVRTCAPPRFLRRRPAAATPPAPPMPRTEVRVSLDQERAGGVQE